MNHRSSCTASGGNNRNNRRPPRFDQEPTTQQQQRSETYLPPSLNVGSSNEKRAKRTHAEWITDAIDILRPNKVDPQSNGTEEEDEQQQKQQPTPSAPLNDRIESQTVENGDSVSTKSNGRQTNNQKIECSTTSDKESTPVPSHPPRTGVPEWSIDFASEITESISANTYVFAQGNSLGSDDGIDQSFLTSLDTKEILHEKQMLGVGSFNQIWRVRVGDRPYALKHVKIGIVSPSLAVIPPITTAAQSVTGYTKTRNCDDFVNAATALSREVSFLSKICHPHITKIEGWSDGLEAAYAVGRRHDSFFLLLELLQEENLQQRIDRWKQELQQSDNNNVPETSFSFPPLHRTKEQLTICFQIADALEYLHARNIVYRGLKPGHVAFARSSSYPPPDDNDDGFVHAKLLDFGLACDLSAIQIIGPQAAAATTTTGTSSSPAPPHEFDRKRTIGTLRYTAPEVCLGQPYGTDCDVYSWAILSYEILSMTKPYQNMTPDVYKKIVCLNGYRPTSSATRSVATSLEPREQLLPMEYRVLLEQSWASVPSKRLPLPLIKQRLDSFLLKERQLLSKV